MAKAMKEFDAAKFKKEVQESMEKIDIKKCSLDMEKMQTELGKIGPEIEKSLRMPKWKLKSKSK